MEVLTRKLVLKKCSGMSSKVKNSIIVDYISLLIGVLSDDDLEKLASNDVDKVVAGMARKELARRRGRG
ncbi:MAG: hypothetical protein J7L82_00930 [Staphylothermus sp.]|nr:hypothetical protein [Staphylothermus sp.]